MKYFWKILLIISFIAMVICAVLSWCNIQFLYLTLIAFVLFAVASMMCR